MKEFEPVVALEDPNFLTILNERDKDVVLKAIEIYHDYVDGIRAKNISDKVKNGQMKTYTIVEVSKRLGL